MRNNVITLLVFFPALRRGKAWGNIRQKRRHLIPLKEVSKTIRFVVCGKNLSPIAFECRRAREMLQDSHFYVTTILAVFTFLDKLLQCSFLEAGSTRVPVDSRKYSFPLRNRTWYHLVGRREH